MAALTFPLEMTLAFTPESQALIERISALQAAAAPAIAATKLPEIPKAEPTEIYAGIAFDEAGKPTHHLFLLNANPGKKLKWKDAVEWAEGLGASLPTRFESALLYANLRSQFDTNGWYWTGTQYSADVAWGQYFDYGYQVLNDQSYEALVRAVRRLEI